MDAWRIEGLAVPFCAGVFTAFSLNTSSHLLFYAFCLCTGLVLICVLGIFKRQFGLAHLVLIYFLSGFVCFAAADAGTPYSTTEKSRFESGVDTLSANFKRRIDSIPYKDRESGALAKAMLSGDRSSLSNETVDVFRQSGAAHLLALSGMHLGIVYSIMLILLAAAGNSPAIRKWRSVVIVLAATLYTLICGASASLTRALIFIILNELHKIFGRKRSAVRVLSVAMMTQLAINPLIIGTVSFQLSYLAMCGITFIYPKIKAWYPDSGSNRRLSRPDLPRWIWNLAALSISCQLFTAPLAWIRFGTFPKYFLMTNLTAAPLTSIIMSLCFLCLFFTALGICPDFLVMCNEKTIKAFIGALTVISEM